MLIYPAFHYSIGWPLVDYELQTTIPGLYAAGEAISSITEPTPRCVSSVRALPTVSLCCTPFQYYLSTRFRCPGSHTELKCLTCCKSVQERINMLMSIEGRCYVVHFQRKWGK